MTLPTPERWAQLSPMLDQWLDLDAQGQQALLAQWQATKPDLAEELLALVSPNRSAPGWMTGHADPVQMAAAKAEPPAPNLAGQRLGPYSLEAPLGQGGGGSVWRAHRVDGRFEGAVAVKLLHLALLGSAGAERFRREGQILARLQHPHIAHLLDAGVSTLGQPYLVLELVEGQAIDRHCDAQRMTVEQRLALFAQVLSAVAHAHSVGAIHRDIKPSNILVSPQRAVKLLDFGIAKLLDEQSGLAAETELTRQSGRAMTPAYAAPEQLRGEPVSTASDVYALGLLLYQLLSGRHPRALALGPEGGPPRLSRAGGAAPAPQQNGNPDWPTAQALASARSSSAERLARRLQGDLEVICACAMHEEPQKRYATVAALADDLQRHLRHEPVAARADAWSYRAAKFVRRYRGAVTAAALVLCAIGLGAAGTFTQARRAERERALMQYELSQSETANTLLAALLGSVADKPFTPAEMLQRAEATVLKRFATEPDKRATVQIELSRLWQTLGDQERSVKLAEQALGSANASKDLATQYTAACIVAAAKMYSQGEYDQARQQFDHTLGAIARDFPLEPGRAMTCLQSRAVLNLETNQPEAALADVAQAEALLRPDAGTGQAEMVLMLGEIRADALAALGRQGQAIAAYEKLLLDQDRLGQADMTSAITRLNNYGVTLMRSGQTLRARETLLRGMKLAQANASTDKLDVPTQTNLARALHDTGRSAEALTWLQNAMAISLRSGERRYIGNVALNGAPVACALGELVLCETWAGLAAEHLGAIMPPGHPAHAQAKALQAELALAKGQPQAALPLVDAALQALGGEAAKGQTALTRLPVLTLKARVQLANGDAAGAAQTAQQGVALSRSLYPDFPHTSPGGKAWLALGSAQRVLGQGQGQGQGQDQQGPLQGQGQLQAARTSLREARLQLEAAAGPSSPAAELARSLLSQLPAP